MSEHHGTTSIGGTPVPPIGVRWVLASRRGIDGGTSVGASAAPFDDFNLGGRVGDDPIAVQRNWGTVADAAGLTGGDLVLMGPVHGASVALVDRPRGTDDPVEGVDALVTTRPGIGLLAVGADCVPMAIADPVAGVIAAVHCGWMGLVAGVVDATLNVMVGSGADPARCSVLVGPSICGYHYPVPQDRHDLVNATVPSAAVYAQDGQPAVDVGIGVVAQLIARGIPRGNVAVSGGCTAGQPERWYSYRRDGITGRQGVLVTFEGDATDVLR